MMMMRKTIQAKQNRLKEMSRMIIREKIKLNLNKTKNKTDHKLLSENSKREKKQLLNRERL